MEKKVYLIYGHVISDELSRNYNWLSGVCETRENAEKVAEWKKQICTDDGRWYTIEEVSTDDWLVDLGVIEL